MAENSNQKHPVPTATSPQKQYMWPYVLIASLLILGIAIAGMIWAAYWRFGFLCLTNSNVWCDNDYTCPGMYQVDMYSTSPPVGLAAQSSQPTIVNVQSTTTGVQTVPGTVPAGGILPPVMYGQDLLTRFSVNRCKSGLYELVNRVNNPTGVATNPPILCNCLGPYARQNTALIANAGGSTNIGADANKYNGYSAFCTTA
jgi:hypothetical protein